MNPFSDGNHGRVTEYNGIVFRSQLEARWAIIFDDIGIPYSYEPESFEVDSGLWYVPDFWLPEQQVWIEIKGRPPNMKEERKAIGLFRLTRCPVYLFAGNPRVHSFVDEIDGVLTKVLEISGFGIYKASDKGLYPFRVGTTCNNTLVHILQPAMFDFLSDVHMSRTLLACAGARAQKYDVHLVSVGQAANTLLARLRQNSFGWTSLNDCNGRDGSRG